MISAELLGDGPALDRLRALRDSANAGLARAIAKLGIDLQNHVQQDKLSGQVLKVRSGALRSSIDVETDQSATTITTTVFTDHLDYAAAQEYGFFGTVNVRASLRQIKEAFGHPIAAKTISVRAHSRQVDLPARSFLQSALDDMAPNISADVEDALREAITS
jgi:phage gpG-like protein